MFLEKVKNRAFDILYLPFSIPRDGISRKSIGPEVHYDYTWTGQKRHDIQIGGELIIAEIDGEIVFPPR